MPDNDNVIHAEFPQWITNVTLNFGWMNEDWPLIKRLHSLLKAAEASTDPFSVTLASIVRQSIIALEAETLLVTALANAIADDEEDDRG